jgi:ABC-type uncharacterized transport system fused permease/ATPase subunit
MLSIGDGKQGYTVTEIDAREIEQKVKAAARESVLTESMDNSIRTHKLARNTQYSDYDADTPLANKHTTWTRAMRIWNIARPERCLVKFGGIAAFILVQVLVDDRVFTNTGKTVCWESPYARLAGLTWCLGAVWQFYRLPGKMFGALTSRDKPQMLRLFRNGALLAGVQAIIEESLMFLRMRMGTDLGERFERHMINRVAKRNAFYHLAQVDSRCPDFYQRISRDAGALVRGNLGNVLIGAISPLLRVSYFTVKLGVLMGFKWIAGMFLYYAWGGFVIKRCMPDFEWLWSTSSKLDSKFTYEHVRIKTCAESIAFFRGGEKEQEVPRALEFQWY